MSQLGPGTGGIDMKTTIAILAAGVALMAGNTAMAADAEGWKLSGNIGMVSDYQYRGYSLSNGDPSIQGDLTVTSPKGYYATVWTSQIEEVGIGPDGDGAEIEVDVSLGRSFSRGGWDWDAALYYYSYPDGTDLNYFEVPVSAAHTVGAFTTTLGVEYAPSQDNLGGEDNLYLYLGGDYAPEHWPVSVNAQIGHEEGAFSDGKFDWQLGLAKSVGPVSLTLQYSGSDDPGAKASLVGGVSIGF